MVESQFQLSHIQGHTNYLPILVANIRMLFTTLHYIIFIFTIKKGGGGGIMSGLVRYISVLLVTDLKYMMMMMMMRLC